MKQNPIWRKYEINAHLIQTVIAHQAEHARESDEDSDDLDSASCHPNIISDRDDERNMVETSTEADGDDLDFSLDEEDNMLSSPSKSYMTDFDEKMRNASEVVGKELTITAFSGTILRLEKMLFAERLKNQKLQTELDQVQQDHSTKKLLLFEPTEILD